MFPAEIRTWAQEGRADGKRFTLGSTGPVLQGLGAIESDIYMNSDKINTILKVHPEMTIREIQKIPEILEDPVLVLKSRNVGRGNRQNTRIVLFGAVRAENGQPVMSVLDFQPVEGGFLIDDMQKVNSAYTRSNAANYVRNSEVLYADEKRTIPLLRSFLKKGNQSDSSPDRLAHTGSERLLRSGYVGSISYDRGNVNISGVPFSSVVEIGERSSNEMGEGADQRNRAGRYSVKTPLADPAQEEIGTGTPEPTGLSLPAPLQARTDSTHWMDKDKRAVYHETEETPLLPLRWNGETPIGAENGASSTDSSIEKTGTEKEQGTGLPRRKNQNRPTWKQSEEDAAKDYAGYIAQQSFKNGKIVAYGTKGSVRPDYYQPGCSGEVKNYNLETAKGRNNLVYNIKKQYEKRQQHLPDGTKQSVQIDIRGQTVSELILNELYEKIMKKTNYNITVRFRTE